ncbi:MAG: sigma-70 family RNA polymerase sigma factor [Verrucomicrobiota bacterium]
MSFATTRWTQVMSAAAGDSTEAREALTELCQDYYEPVVAYLERSGLGRDVAHDFFEDLLTENRLKLVDRDKGRFRSYLLGALKHFISHQRERERAAKRGGNATHLSLEETPSIEDAESAPPDVWFDQQWAMALLGRALKMVEEECRESGAEEQFQHLKPWLTGEAEYGDQAELATRVGVPANTLKSTIHRLRRRFRNAVKAEIARTLAEPANVDAEMEALFSALSD